MSNPHDSPVRGTSTELNQLQRWFQSVITHADGVEAGAQAAAEHLLDKTALEEVVTRSHALTASERLRIYANAYYTRLLECLGEVFPMLSRTLGEEGFDGLAFGYLQEYPSRSYTLNELGRHFPGYLERTRPPAASDELESSDCDTAEGPEPLKNDWPGFLIDLARLEWAIYEVFDGPGVEGIPLLGSDQALSIPPERWAEARLKPVVCLRLLATRFPVNDYYTTLRRAPADKAVEMPAAQESFVALTRRNYIVRRYNISRSQFELLQELQAGSSVGEALERILSITDENVDELAAALQRWFKNWTAEGFFESVSLEN